MDHIYAVVAVGAVMGLLAGQVLRGKFNFFIDLPLGLIGAALGGYLFGKLEMAAKTGWIGAAIFAAIGAGVLLIGWRSIGSVD